MCQPAIRRSPAIFNRAILSLNCFISRNEDQKRDILSIVLVGLYIRDCQDWHAVGFPGFRFQVGHCTISCLDFGLFLHASRNMNILHVLEAQDLLCPKPPSNFNTFISN